MYENTTHVCGGQLLALALRLRCLNPLPIATPLPALLHRLRAFITLPPPTPARRP